MHGMMRAGVPLTLLTRHSRLRGQMLPINAGRLRRRMGQHQMFIHDFSRLCAARRIVARKLQAMHRMIERCVSNHPGLRAASARHELQRMQRRIPTITDLGALRGIEGTATRAYWRFFRAANRSELHVPKRAARPPHDPVNALLSLGYTLLAQDLSNALYGHALNAELVFFHAPRPGRPALARDLLEPLRHDIIDRLVLKSYHITEVRWRGVQHAIPPYKADIASVSLLVVGCWQIVFRCAAAAQNNLRIRLRLHPFVAPSLRRFFASSGTRSHSAEMLPEVYQSPSVQSR